MRFGLDPILWPGFYDGETPIHGLLLMGDRTELAEREKPAATVGMITMSTSDGINAATDTILALRPGIAELGNRVGAVVDASDRPSRVYSVHSPCGLVESKLPISSAQDYSLDWSTSLNVEPPTRPRR